MFSKNTYFKNTHWYSKSDGERDLAFFFANFAYEKILFSLFLNLILTSLIDCEVPLKE